MKNKKITVALVIIVLLVCHCTNSFALVTPSSYMNYKKAEIAMIINSIWFALLIICLVIAMIFFRKDKIKKKRFNIWIMIIGIQIVICLSAFFISKTIYDKNYQEYQNYLDFKNGKFNFKIN